MKEEYIAVDVHEVHRPFYRHVSWSAIIAGLVVAMVIQILLTMLGVAIGAATIQPLEERNPVEGLGVGAGIWWFVTGLIALFVGAFVAGRFSSAPRKKDGALHGFLMWSAATVFTFMAAGTMLGGMFATGFTAISQPGNRHELKKEFEQNKDRLGIGDQSRNDYEGDYEGDYDSDYAQLNRTGSDIHQSPATPYTYDAQGTNRIDGRAPADNNATGNTVTQRDDYRMGTGNTGTMTDRSGVDTSTSTVGSVDSDNDRAAGNKNLLNTENAGDDDKPVVAGSQEEAEVREAGEKVADTTAKAALIGLFVLLIGAGTCAWAGSRGVPHDYVPPRELDARVTGAIPGEPVKG